MLKKALLAILISLLLGVGSVFLVVGVGVRQFIAAKAVRVGGWKYHPDTGSAQAEVYTSVYIALTALFALDRNESIYFLADTDENGNPLDPGKTYRISGGNLEVRWWSVTAYLDYHLIPNDAGVYSFSKTGILTDTTGHWEVWASSQRKGESILPLGSKKGQLDLILRCFHPSAKFREALAKGTLQLPVIQSISNP